MTAVKNNKKPKQKNLENLFKGYFWYYSNLYKNIQTVTDTFFEKDFSLRLISITKEDNIFFYGDEYFVNKIPVNKMSDIKIRISSKAISSILDNALGVSQTPFALKNLTDIEAMLIKSFTVSVYKSFEDLLDKTEVNKKVIDSAQEYDITFYLRINGEHAGKIILSIPDYMLPDIELKENKEVFDISDFEDIKVKLNICAGISRITLNDIKNIDIGDVILLEHSNINEMSVLWQGRRISFRINPNPSLIISVNSNGGNNMEDETSSKSQNMWDSILVDIVAEFDNVKLTLGELKQISEGLVIDVGSVYDNKIRLRVENQVVATGELVILNDRYGVRVENVLKTKDKKAAVNTPEGEKQAQKNDAPQKGKQKKPQAPQGAKAGDENFDYSDFEIEDESI